MENKNGINILKPLHLDLQVLLILFEIWRLFVNDGLGIRIGKKRRRKGCFTGDFGIYGYSLEFDITRMIDYLIKI